MRKNEDGYLPVQHRTRHIFIAIYLWRPKLQKQVALQRTDGAGDGFVTPQRKVALLQCLNRLDIAVHTNAGEKNDQMIKSSTPILQDRRIPSLAGNGTQL